MRTSLIAGLTMAFLSISQANDQISLKNGDLFFGKVIALKGGLIELQNPHSEAPLKILNKNLIKLNFSADYSEKETPDELPKNSQELYLRNGDSIPGEVVGLTPTHLSFQTWFAGLLEIPREQIDSVFFGVTPQRNIFRGPIGIEGWSQENNGRWRYEDGASPLATKGLSGGISSFLKALSLALKLAGSHLQISAFIFALMGKNLKVTEQVIRIS